jgi:hypothetical protein
MSIPGTEGVTEPARKPKARPTARPMPTSLLEHVKREFRFISKHQLTVPVDEYQRDESTGLIAKDIALNYNRVAFGALTVIARSNGNGGGVQFVVADGGTRLAAAMMRDDIDDLPCLVFSGLTKEQEADVFLAINQNRRKLQIEQLHHSEVFAGRALALEAEKILLAFRDHRIDFNSLSALRGCVRRYPKPTGIVVEILIQCAMDKHLGMKVFKGLVFLEHHLNKHERTLRDRKRIKRLREKFGLLDTAVNAATSSQNVRSSDPLICARAIAREISVVFPK